MLTFIVKFMSSALEFDLKNNLNPSGLVKLRDRDIYSGKKYLMTIKLKKIVTSFSSVRLHLLGQNQISRNMI